MSAQTVPRLLPHTEQHTNILGMPYKECIANPTWSPSNTKSTTGGNTAGNEVETEGVANNQGIKLNSGISKSNGL